jgi:signal peptide peptidase SppA
MKYHQIMTALMEEPLLLTPAAHASLVRLFDEHRGQSAEEFQSRREGVDLCGEEVELEQMEIIDGIAHIPIGGPIGKGFGKFEKGAGAVDVDDVRSELDQAEQDPLVRAIILDIDSPGGMVKGTPELADRVAACDKPIYTFCAGCMCSAAYWIGSAADMICATKTADIGSIGVYCALVDSSERYKAMGVKVDVIAAGKYKGAGIPGTALSPDHREQLQNWINETAAMFYEHVQAMRPDASLEDMQGQVFKAKSAMARGLIDQVVDGKEDVVALLG